jgi:hypothetical protein
VSGSAAKIHFNGEGSWKVISMREKSRHGFGAMDAEKQRAIAIKGGKDLCWRKMRLRRDSGRIEDASQAWALKRPHPCGRLRRGGGTAGLRSLRDRLTVR